MMLLLVGLWAGCSTGTTDERAWLSQLQHSEILRDPPAGFDAPTVASLLGNEDYPDIRVGGYVSAVYTYEMSMPDAINAWANRLEELGWTLIGIDCDGSIAARQELDGFQAKATVRFVGIRTSLRLNSPPSDQPNQGATTPIENTARC
jgi:hypothetical protein